MGQKGDRSKLETSMESKIEKTLVEVSKYENTINIDIQGVYTSLLRLIFRAGY